MKVLIANVKELIIKHQLIGFFICTYIFSWLLMLPVIITQDQQTYGIFGLLGLFGPALVHILISKWVSEKIAPRKKKRIITFLFIWIVSTAAFSLNVWLNSGIESPIAIIIFAIVSLLPTFVWASGHSKHDLVRQSLASLVRPKGKWKFYLFAFLMAPGIKLVSLPLSNLLDLQVLSSPDTTRDPIQLIIFVVITFFWGIFFAGGLNEEVGWSGFALPRLQKIYNPFVASVLLWFFWIMWHVPMQIGGFWNADLESFIRAVIGTFFARFMLTWLYNKTEGGILAAMILHVSANVSFEVLPSTYPSMVLEAMLATYLIVKFKMYKKLSENDTAI